jgi:hypothetical protein
MKYFFILLLLIPFLACSTNGTVSNTDFIEIKISNQIWSTNLGIETPNSICPENCETVGRLYTYELTFRKRKILKIDKKCGCCYLVGKIAKDARPKIT